MTLDEKTLAEFLSLCGAVRDGSLNVEQFQKLQAVLQESAEARAYYVQFMQLACFFENQDQVAMERLMDGSDQPSIPTNLAAESSLGSVLGAPPVIAPTDEQPLSGPLATQAQDLDAGIFQKLWAGFRLPMAWLLAGSVLTAAIMLLVRPAAHLESQPATETPLMSAAHLTSANGCAWGGSAPQIHTVGSSIRVGDEIALREGIAEFRLASGVSMNVEGPAALLLASSTSVVLQHGKLTMHAPWEAPEIRILAGDCRLTARNAEFGVDVVRNTVEVHAFSGDVLVARSPFADNPVAGNPIAGKGLTDDLDDGRSFVPITVSEGKAFAFVGDQDGLEAPVENNADRSRFASNLSMGRGLPVSRQYVNTILNVNPALRPVSFWRFESLDGGVVRNEIEGAPNLTVVGELCLSGDVSNRSVDLGRPHSSGRLVSDGEIPSLDGRDYTVELWAKPSHFHQGVLATLTTGPQKPGNELLEAVSFRIELERGYGLGIGKPGSVRFLHRNPPGLKRGTSCYSNCLYGLRRWQHIVAVKRGESMQLYHDGQKVAEAMDKKRLPHAFYLAIGQHFCSDLAAGQYAFVGQLDELAIYGRALSTDEIVRHYEIIRSEQHKPSDI